MSLMKPLSCVAVLSLFLTANLVSAETRLNNLTTQQYRVEAALNDYNAKKSSYDHATKLIKEQTARVQQQEKRLATEREQLEKRKLERSQMDAELAKLKSVVDIEERELNVIWDRTHR